MICSLCDARCCKNYVITITIFDLIRIEQCKGHYSSFAEIRNLDILNYDPDFVIKYENNNYGLLTLKSHPCIFLKHNRCSIWKCAPMVCKLYPYNVKGKFIGSCPLLSSLLFRFKKPSHVLLKKAEKEFGSYKQIVAKINTLNLKKNSIINKMKEYANSLHKDK